MHPEIQLVPSISAGKADLAVHVFRPLFLCTPVGPVGIDNSSDTDDRMDGHEAHESLIA